MRPRQIVKQYKKVLRKKGKEEANVFLASQLVNRLNSSVGQLDKKTHHGLIIRHLKQLYFFYQETARLLNHSQGRVILRSDGLDGGFLNLLRNYNEQLANIWEKTYSVDGQEIL